jgi:hypothetical protein
LSAGRAPADVGVAPKIAHVADQVIKRPKARARQRVASPFHKPIAQSGRFVSKSVVFAATRLTGEFTTVDSVERVTIRHRIIPKA